MLSSGIGSFSGCCCSLRCGLTYHSGASQPLNVACCLLPMNPRLLQEGSITTVFVAHDWNTVERLTGGPHVLGSKQAGQN